jgi:hypothetical protein
MATKKLVTAKAPIEAKKPIKAKARSKAKVKHQDHKTLEDLVGDAVIYKKPASQKKYLGALEKALSDGLDPDSPDPERNGRTLLFNRSITPSVAKLLLDAGANASYIDEKGYQPLHSVNVTVAPLLLAAGADIEATSHYPYVTPLITHAIRGDAKMVTFLLDNGADVLARWDHWSKDVFDAAQDNADDDAEIKSGKRKILFLVEQKIAEGLASRRFLLSSLQGVRRSSRVGSRK